MIDGDETSERFMLSARKRKKSKSANYLMSLDEEDMSRNSGNFFGAGFLSPRAAASPSPPPPCRSSERWESGVTPAMG
jgi:hypothetical protein